MLKKFFYLAFFFSVFLFLSYKLTSIPPGINTDESSIGYNASLLAENFQDENSRFLPVFILTLDGQDWKQPISVYSTAFLFKVLGRSYFNLRLVSVIFALASALIFFKLLRFFFSSKLSLIGTALFITSPSILIQSHLALENIASLPPFLLWLYFLFSHSFKPRKWKILLSGVFLGLSFYSYKGMHAMVPVYLIVSLFYLFYLNIFKKTIDIKTIFLFLLGIVPFLVPIKWLQVYYAGAIYDPGALSFPSLFDAAYVYLSSFDFSFLFVRGDKMLVHSTGRHGMFLLPTLVLFFLGLFQLKDERNHYFYFLLAVLLFTPLPLIFVDSVYRASRLMTYIPLATFIFTLGVKRILDMKEGHFKYLVVFLLTIALSFSYLDFVRYYWNDYPKMVSQYFSPNFNQAMSDLRDLGLEKKKEVYLEKILYDFHKTDVQFFREIYFAGGNLKIWVREKEKFPENGLVLTPIGGSGEIKNYKEILSLESGQQAFYVVGK